VLAGVSVYAGLLAFSGPAANASPAGTAAKQSRATAIVPAGNLAQIVGTGSSWAYYAIAQWIANVHQSGVQVVYTPTGSAAGRQDFGLATTDFGVSDIGYQGYDPVTQTNDTSTRHYAYLPITGGGTAFPYNIVVGGHRITNLRLSGKTLAEIFTNHITNWDAQAITNDNNGRKLPSMPIITVVPSEGSGTTAMFTRYLNFLFRSLWQPFNNGKPGMTEYWPRQGSSQVAQNGSTQIMNYVSSPNANGAIGFAEYAYALASHFPVVNLENAAGYYVLPSEYNDAVALTQAQINYNPASKDYLLQNLNRVYTFNDPRAYPLASYSYTIMPTANSDPRMAVPSGQFPAKWQTLAKFLSYSICQGQTYIGPIGYSALPLNLVEAGFKQIDKIKAAAPKVSLGQLNVHNCHNPTFVFGHPSANHLAQIAPQPPTCDKTGHGPCSGVLNANANHGRGSGPSPSPSPSSSPGASLPPGGSSPGPVVPVTGPTITGPVAGPAPTAVPITLTSGQDPGLSKGLLGALVLLLLLGALVLPPLLYRRWSSRGGQP